MNPERLEPVPTSTADQANTDRPTVTAQVMAQGEWLPFAASLGPRRTVPNREDEFSARPQVPGYEVLEELGRGGMGVVYKARQLALNRLVALKMVLAGGGTPESELARFHLEAEAAAQLQHPNIVQVYEVGTCDVGLGKRCPFMVMELVEGPSLHEWLKQGLPPSEAAADLVAVIARAVHAAHQRGIIHRDLKPANILLAVGFTAAEVAADGPKVPSDKTLHPQAAKIADFGLAKRLQSDSQLTQSGTIVGTPAYMPPEQASGNRSAVSTLSDVYSLGAILYEVLTGRPPFQAETPMATLLQVISEPVQPPRQLNAKLDATLETICLKCLAKEPGERYGSAEALADDLERWRRGEPIAAQAPGLATLLRHWLRQNFGSAAWTVALGIVYGLAAGVAIYMWNIYQLAAGAAVAHARIFPSTPLPFGAWSFGDQRLFYPPILLACAGFIATVGLVTVYLVRPRNASADWAVGLTVGTVASLVLFITSMGQWAQMWDLARVFRDDLHHLGLSASLSDPRAPEALLSATRRRYLGVPPERGPLTASQWLLEQYPDLLKQPPERRGYLLAQRLFDVIMLRLPIGIWVGLLYAFAIALPTGLAQTLAAGWVWRTPGKSGVVVRYFELAGPLMALAVVLADVILTAWLDVESRPSHWYMVPVLGTAPLAIWTAVRGAVLPWRLLVLAAWLAAFGLWFKVNLIAG